MVEQPEYLHKQKFFTDWLKVKGYEWPSDPVEQENIIAEWYRTEVFVQGG